MRRAVCARSAVAVLAAMLIAGCTSGGAEPDDGQPSLGSFRAGDCQGLAPDVLAIGRDARRLGASASPAQEVRDALKGSQARIRAVQPSLDPELSEPVQGLVEAIGAVRLASDTNNLTTSTTNDLSAAYRRLIDVCTGTG